MRAAVAWNVLGPLCPSVASFKGYWREQKLVSCFSIKNEAFIRGSGKDASSGRPEASPRRPGEEPHLRSHSKHYFTVTVRRQAAGEQMTNLNGETQTEEGHVTRT